MGRLAPTPTTGMTQIHAKLLEAVKACGFSTDIEVEFHPYKVDVWVEEIRTAFEADGPMHSKKRDAHRDAILRNYFNVRVVRFKGRVINRLSTQELSDAVREQVTNA